MQTNDRQITELMKTIHSGTTQLPDFQRGWVWDDNRIRALIASITCNFPVGAAMFLEYGNENPQDKLLIYSVQAKEVYSVIGNRYFSNGEQVGSLPDGLYLLHPCTRTREFEVEQVNTKKGKTPTILAGIFSFIGGVILGGTIIWEATKK